MPTRDESPPVVPTIDFTYRYEPSRPKPLFAPANWQEAETFLWAGNDMIGRFYEACRLGGYEPGKPAPVVHLSDLEAEGEPRGDDGLPVQYPFVLVIGCSDARVPAEILFGQEFNDIFNVRVAGNVLGVEAIGSLQYAVRTFVPDDPGRPRSLKGVVVLGHRGCGAVRATISHFQAGTPYPDEPLGAILRHIDAPALSVAVKAYDATYGEGAARDPANLAAMVELVVHLNAAWGAHQALGWVQREGEAIASKVGVVFGVFDPGDFQVRSLPEVSRGSAVVPMFGAPPRDLGELETLAMVVAKALSPASSGVVA